MTDLLGTYTFLNETNQSGFPRKRVNLNYMLRGKDGKSSRADNEKAVNNDDLKSPGVLSENFDQEIKDKDVVTEEFHHLRISTDRENEFSPYHRKEPFLNTTSVERSQDGI